MLVKQLPGTGAREASVYEKLLVSHAREIAPRLLAVDYPDNDRSILYVEWVCRFSNWRWRELSTAEQFINRLARLHIATAADHLPPRCRMEL